ncbi:HlyD family efflux transporter periplasmic adaptor subunit [Paenibacillus sp. FSL R7-0272]|uniref:HlyD family efflux transporter periplasmic adaptor subunit n=1 Tax=Paenibacillus sp. FSL R7-0272 TaxID=2921679 RepID=UPI0030EC8141
MSTKLNNFEEMIDTREILERKSPKFISWFLVLLAFTLMIALLWSWKAQIDIVIKSSGTVRPNEKISKVVNKATGSVSKVYVRQGQQVEEGEKLFSIQTGTLEKDKAKITEEYEKIEKNLTGLKQLYAIVQSGDQTKIQTYTSNTVLGKSNSVENKLKLEISQTIKNQAKTDVTISNKRLLLKSLNYGENYLVAKDAEYERYENFMLKIKQNLLAEEQLQEDYKRAIFSNDETAAGTVMDKIKTLKLQLETSRSEFRYTVQTELQTALEQKENIDKQKSDLYVQLQVSIEELNKQISDLNSQSNVINTTLDKYTNIAPISGVINMLSDIGEGQLIQEGLQVMDIVPTNNTIYSVQIVMNHQDIGRIHEGDGVRFHFAAYPREEYGSVMGKIQSISSDALINPKDGSSYYIVEASLEKNSLINTLGQEVTIKSGMQTEAYVITEQKSALQWILEKIDFWSK